MKLLSLLSFIVSAAFVFAQDPTTGLLLNTPDAVQQCFVTLLSWTPGTTKGPYRLLVMQGGGSDILETLGDSLAGTTYSWTVKQPAGQQVFLRLIDSTTGTTVSTAPFIIQAGNVNCTGAGSGSSTTGVTTGGTTGGTSAPPATPSTTPPTGGQSTTTPAGGNNTPSSPANGSSTRTSSGASNTQTTSQGGGAGQLKAPVLLAGAAAVAMAVFA